MKIYEIISEEQQVDERLGVKPAADAVQKAYRGYKRSKDLKAAQAAKKARQEKNIFGQSKYDLKGLKGQERIDMIAKRAAASATAAAKAKKAITSASTVLQALGVGVIVYNYLTQIAAVEEDFEEFKAAKEKGKELSSDNMFASMESVEEARAKALETREELLGYATAQMLAVVGIAGKFVSVLGSAIKIIPGIGPVIGYPLKGLGWVITKLSGSNSTMATSVRLALTAWISSPQGIEFLRYWSNGILIGLGRYVTKELGSATAFAIDKLVELGDQAAAWVSKETGLNIKVPDAVKSKLTPTQAEKDASAAQDLARNAKKVYVNDVLVTDYDGYLTTSRDVLLSPKIKNELWRAKQAGKPNPLAAIPKKPDASYPPEVLN